jgi:hypothetical protein
MDPHDPEDILGFDEVYPVKPNFLELRAVGHAAMPPHI